VKIKRAAPVALFAAVLALASCESLTPESLLVSDTVVDADMAASAGDAIAQAVADMAVNEGLAGLSLTSDAASMDAAGANPEAQAAADVVYNRARTCYDASDAVVANCTPLSQVRKVVTHATLTGTRSGSSSTEGGPTRTWTVTVDVVADDTLQRLFSAASPTQEIARTHSALLSGDNSVEFVQGSITRTVDEIVKDTVKALRWNLPRTQNPWPVSGQIVRAANWHVVASSENRSVERDVSRLVRVLFPADAQGNVTLEINDKSCTLNLVTRFVSGCQ
jgi:hypothetical protein